MYIYMLVQNETNDYDAYESAIVVAPNTEAAKRIDPAEFFIWDDNRNAWCYSLSKDVEYRTTWPNDLSKIKVFELGKANDYLTTGVLLAKYAT